MSIDYQVISIVACLIAGLCLAGFYYQRSKSRRLRSLVEAKSKPLVDFFAIGIVFVCLVVIYMAFRFGKEVEKEEISDGPS